MQFKILLLIVLCFTTALFVQAQTPAFPTAEGFGKWATGGRGGKVVEVTTLEDDGIGSVSGSLRWALKQYSGSPITVVFRVSGIIDLKGVSIRSKRNNITIAGQTAPGDGICIKGGNFNLGGSYNIIVRNIRFRVGKYANDTYLPGAPFNLENGGNFILDHCSFSWSAEEALGLYDDLNQTVQWCMFTEGLYTAGHPKGSRGYGPVIGGTNTSFHHNIIAHTVSRSPRFGCSDNVDRYQFIDFVNNVNYNWGGSKSCYGGENERNKTGSSHINFVNNYWKPGPAYPGTSKSYLTQASWSSLVGLDSTYFTKYHINGNYVEGSANTSINTNNYNGFDFAKYAEAVPAYTVQLRHFASPHFDVKDPVATETAQNAYISVLAKAGALPLDTVDRRIKMEIRTGTATSASSFKGNSVTGIIDKPEDCGGYPTYNTYNTITDNDHDGMDDAWEITNGLDPTDVNDGNKLTLSGYTALEVYINGLVGEKIELEFNTDLKSVFNPTVSIKQTDSVVRISSNNEICQYNVYDIVGKQRYDIVSFDANNLDLCNLNKGVYFLRIKTIDSKNTVFKIIKK